MPTRRLENLDSLRGIAAVSVVFLHFSSYLFPAIGASVRQVTPLLDKSYLAVDLFFMLSGFVLALTYHHNFKSLSSAGYIRFSLKRLIRVYPLHFITLMYLVVLRWGIERNIDISADWFQVITSIKTFFLNLTLTHSWGIFDNACYICTSWNYPSWSISTEFLSYLLFPFILFLSMKLKKTTIVFSFLVPIIIYFAIETKFGHIDVALKWGQFKCLLEVVSGVALYYLYEMKIGEKLSKHLLLASVVAFVLILQFQLADSITLPLIALMIFIVALNQSLLNYKILKYLGDISFALYLVHVPVQNTFSLIYRYLYSENVKLMSFSFQIFWLFVCVIISLILADRLHFKIDSPLQTYLREKLKSNK